VSSPTTLAFDIGGSGLKATVLDAAGQPLADRVRVATTYPLAPAAMVDALAGLAAQLPAYDRISARSGPHRTSSPNTARVRRSTRRSSPPGTASTSPARSPNVSASRPRS
jgi:predicted NBD/HSP70 family sugar kinase